MTPAEFRNWMDRLGLTLPDAARLLEVHRSTIARWRSEGCDRVVTLACEHLESCRGSAPAATAEE